MSMFIDKMLTISTAHVRPETCRVYLHSQWRRDAASDVTVYLKSVYGWFICVPAEGDPLGDHVPQDLREVMEAARSRGCSWLCLDRDAEELPDLQTYAWED